MQRRTITYGENLKEWRSIFISLLVTGVVGLTLLQLAESVAKGVAIPDEVMS